MKIVVYTSPACASCHQLMDFLNENKVKFKEVDLSENQEMIEELIKKTGQMTVPVTEIDGELILGFEGAKIRKKLNIK